jgi:hypothetical protein
MPCREPAGNESRFGLQSSVYRREAGCVWAELVSAFVRGLPRHGTANQQQATTDAPNKYEIAPIDHQPSGMRKSGGGVRMSGGGPVG